MRPESFGQETGFRNKDEKPLCQEGCQKKQRTPLGNQEGMEAKVGIGQADLFSNLHL